MNGEYDELGFAHADEPVEHVGFPPRKCRRHEWAKTLAEGIEGARRFGDGPARCLRCGKVRDEVARRRNKNNRLRGGAFERKVADDYGGRRTGPLLGRDDVVVGELFAIQTKKTERSPSLNEARQYLDDLARTFPERMPVVIHSLPGKGGDAVVIWRYSDHLAMHGPDAKETAA